MTSARNIGVAVAAGLGLIGAAVGWTLYRKRKDDKPKVVFVLGGPGAGKGTQCAKLVENFNWVHLSAGDLLRAEKENKESKNGQLINDYINKGQIVPVEITVNLIKDAMQKHIKNGNTLFLVDGFPRNVDNRDGWDRVMGSFAKVVKVLYFECSETVMEQRLLKRGETSGRSDDKLDVIKKRFNTYVKETKPIIDAFGKEGLVARIDASKSTDEVYAVVRGVISPLSKPAQPKPQAI